MLRCRIISRDRPDASLRLACGGNLRAFVPKGKKKTPVQDGRQGVEAGFIQARNLSSSALSIDRHAKGAKLKV